MSDETAFERLNSENRMRLSSEQIVEFERLGDDEGISRMQSVAEWLSRVNVQNHDGVRVTPTLSALLTQTEDVEGTTSQLDGLRAKTRRGLFDADDELMRELEYHRFVSECGRQRDWPEEPDEQRSLFESLTVLEEQQDDPPVLTDEDLREARRAASRRSNSCGFCVGSRPARPARSSCSGTSGTGETGSFSLWRGTCGTISTFGIGASSRIAQ